jgi:4-hydroxybutyrate CoA-transferase
MISINTAFSVDLLCQVSAESIGYRQYSGTGGQLDYVHGAQMAPCGKSFIAIPSTYTDKKGQLQSRIVLNFPAGTAVTTPRTEVQYVATEYGCVNMKGLSRGDKCRELIRMAHPQFRDQLTEQAKEVGLI